MYLIHNSNINSYFTINKKDKMAFLSLIDNFFEDDDNVFRIIYDKDELNKILNDRFLSKNRGEKYNEEYTSVTKIVGDLFPMDLDKSRGLIYWAKNISKEDYALQQEINEECQNKGTYLHAVIEHILKDKKHYSLRDIQSHINNQAVEQNQLCSKALFEYPKYKDKGKNNWLNNELPYIDTIYSELFIKDDELGLQGTLDGLLIYNKILTLWDLKSTSKIDKKTQKGVHKTPSTMNNYHRQLAMYSYLLEKHGYITKKEFQDLAFKIDCFHWIREDYRQYDFENAYILSLIEDILKVTEWFNNSK